MRRKEKLGGARVELFALTRYIDRIRCRRWPHRRGQDICPRGQAGSDGGYLKLVEGERDGRAVRRGCSRHPMRQPRTINPGFPRLHPRLSRAVCRFTRRLCSSLPPRTSTAGKATGRARCVRAQVKCGSHTDADTPPLVHVLHLSRLRVEKTVHAPQSY